MWNFYCWHSFSEWRLPEFNTCCLFSFLFLFSVMTECDIRFCFRYRYRPQFRHFTVSVTVYRSLVTRKAYLPATTSTFSGERGGFADIPDARCLGGASPLTERAIKPCRVQMAWAVSLATIVGFFEAKIFFAAAAGIITPFFRWNWSEEICSPCVNQFSFTQEIWINALSELFS